MNEARRTDSSLYLPHLRQTSQPHKAPKSSAHPIPSSSRGDIVAIDGFIGKESLPTSEGRKKYVITMIDLFTRFGVAAPIPDQTAQTVVAPLVAR